MYRPAHVVLAALSLAILVTGCAAVQPAGSAASTGSAGSAGATVASTDDAPLPSRYRRADGVLVECHQERTIGSNYTEQVCRTVQQASPTDRRELDRLLLAPVDNAARSGSGAR